MVGKSAPVESGGNAGNVDWSTIPFKLHAVNNINVMTKGCVQLNVVQTMLPGGKDSGVGMVVDFAQATAFFIRLQDAVRTNQRQTVASLLHYPVNLRIRGKQVIAPDQSRFLQLYGALFRNESRDMLLSEHAGDLTSWWEGVSDDKRLVQFKPISGTKDFVITHLADSPHTVRRVK